MKYNVTLNSKVYEVEVERGEAILVSVQDVQVAAPVAAPVAAAPVAAPAAAPAAAAASLAGDVIAAQMPGTVLQVKVGAGDAVTSGQILVVMEAMKMEIEVKAPRDGKVGQIVAQKGATVESGAPLLTLV